MRGGEGGRERGKGKRRKCDDGGEKEAKGKQRALPSPSVKSGPRHPRLGSEITPYVDHPYRVNRGLPTLVLQTFLETCAHLPDMLICQAVSC